MTKRTRRTYSAALKAEVALAPGQCAHRGRAGSRCPPVPPYRAREPLCQRFRQRIRAKPAAQMHVGAAQYVLLVSFQPELSRR